MAKTGYLCYAVFNTEPGWVAVLASDKGIKRLAVPQRTAERALELLGPTIRDVKPHPNFLRDIIKLLRHYFQGREITFPEICDLGEATSFQRRVWEATRLIPYGETQSYRWVADQVGHKGAARAVGQALSKNPVPIIIPCHRVLACNGGLCGFSCGLGWKRFLLELEAESAHTL
jgi:O-6-methylguanine DNA methyltransferase